MKKFILLLLVCVLLFSGCGKAELEQEITDLNEQLEDAEGEIDQLNDEITGLNEEISSLNEKLTLKETMNQELTDDNSQLKEENESLTVQLDELKGPDPEELLGTWMGNTYENSYLGMTMDITDGWFALSEKEIEEVMGVTTDLIYEATEVDYSDISEGAVVPAFYICDNADYRLAMGNMTLSFTKMAYEMNIELATSTATETIETLFNSLGEVTVSEMEDYYFGDKLTKKVSSVVKLNGSDVSLNVDYYYFIQNTFLVQLNTTYIEQNKDMIDEIIETINFK